MTKQPTFTEALRSALRDAPVSRYVIAKQTGIPQSVLSRFASGGNLRTDSLDRLLPALGLELRPVRRKGS